MNPLNETARRCRSRFLVLLNPSSRGGRAPRIWEGYRALLSDAELDVRLLKSIEEARQFAEQASSTSYDAVVACGGDGTVSAAASGLMRNPSRATLPLALLYAGTSPDFCRFHRIPLDPRAATELLRSGQVCETDLLELRRADGSLDYALCSCNLGMGAEVAEAAKRLRPFFGDKAGTLIALLGALLKNRRYSYRINGREIRNCRHLLLTKMPWIAGGLKLNLELGEEDGRFALWHFSSDSIAAFLRLIPSLYRSGRGGETELFEKGAELQIEAIPGDGSRSSAALEYDGDAHGTLPVRIRISPCGLPLIRPPSEASRSESTNHSRAEREQIQ